MPLVTKRNDARSCLLTASFALCILISACAHQPGEPPKPVQVSGTVVSTNDPLHFAVSFPESARRSPASGRVLLFLSKKAGAEPRFGGGFFDLQ
ncbi:MAG TPA: hypothetical protein VMZ27_03285, partial [Candidatus Saccharimonadales bacterium]|nr:hypothetical protein [Candidatus Saccharimonadales bacterium]